MASGKVNMLEQSTRECSIESSLNLGSTTHDTGDNGPSTELMDPSAYESLSERSNDSLTKLLSSSHSQYSAIDPPTDESPSASNNDPSTRLLSSSHPRYSSIEVPVPADGQPTEPRESEGTIVNESFTNRCRYFWNWYKSTAINFRNSCFVYNLLLLFSYVPISAIIMGLLFFRECPQSPSLTIIVTVVGVVGVVFMGLFIAVSCCEQRGTACSNLKKLALGVLFVLFLVILVIEMRLVFLLSPSFNPSHEDYCSETFHYYIKGKEIVCATAVVAGALLYFPGSCLHTNLHTCCQNCSVLCCAFFHMA